MKLAHVVYLREFGHGTGFASLGRIGCAAKPATADNN